MLSITVQWIYNLIEITLRDMLEYYLQIRTLHMFRQLKNYVSATCTG